MTDQSTPETLREQYAAAMREHYLITNRNEADADGHAPCRCGGWREPGPMGSDEDDWDSHLAAVVLAVRDRELERLKLLVAASSEPGQAVRMAAQYADRAIENGKRAEQAEADLARLQRVACRTAENLRHAEARVAELEQLRGALKRAHVALAEQAAKDQAAIARVRTWIDGVPVTARSDFGSGYREALRDITDNLDQAQQPAT